MRLFLIVILEEATQTKMAFLLYEKTRAQAIEEVRIHCREQDYLIQWIYSHDVTIGKDDILRVDNLFQ